MDKRRVKVYKDPTNSGDYVNSTRQFLNKAQMGMQVAPRQQRDITEAVLDELSLDSDLELMAENISREFGMAYEDAMEQIRDVVDGIYSMNPPEDLASDVEIDETPEPIKPSYDYGFNEPSAADDMFYDDVDADFGMEEQQDLPVERNGGTISKKKFVKDTMRKLKKASQGVEQQDTNQGDILDKPIGGRQSLVNNFRRGIKDLGNEYYAKDIYDKTMQLNQEMGSDSFSGDIPMARKGKEQRAADREIRNVNRDWQRMYGDMAVGYMGVPGLPNYLQMISPQVYQTPEVVNPAVTNPAVSPINFNYKKGPWWSGKREWSAQGIPANMLMGMGMNPAYGYMPQSMMYDTRRSYPGEIIRTKTTRPIESKQIGGAVDNPETDQYGNLQRFLYGGNEMPDSPILEYEDNYMSSKDVDDPFMFKDGGLYKYQGQGNSQVNDICTHTNCFPQGNSGQNSNDYNNWLKRKVEKEALVEYNEWMNRNAQGNQNMTSYNANLNDQVYQQILQRKLSGLAGQTNQNTQNNQLRGQTPQLRGQYPTAPSVGQQMRGMFSPFQRNPQTGRNYDFMWASQAGPARTLDGQVFQPTAGVQVPGAAGTQNQMALQGQADPTKAGYYYDYKYEKGPWYKGNKKTLSVTGRWIDPNNPNAGTTPGATSASGATPDAATPNAVTSATSPAIYGPSNQPENSQQMNYSSEEGPFPSRTGLDILSPQQSGIQQPVLEPAPYQDPEDYNRLMEEKQRNQVRNVFGSKPQSYSASEAVGFPKSDVPGMMYGGYNPAETDLYRFQGMADSQVNPENTNAFDPNRPQDFTVDYNLKKARTLNPYSANTMDLLGRGIQEFDSMRNNLYNRDYLASRTTSDNRVPVNYLDYQGGYSGLTQRSVGAPTFTGVVGNAAFVKDGGQIKYQEGGVYDMDEDEIGRILAAGGQIEFI